MRYLYLLFFLLLGLHSHFVFADPISEPSCPGGSRTSTQICSVSAGQYCGAGGFVSNTNPQSCGNQTLGFGTVGFCYTNCSCRDGKTLQQGMCKCPTGTNWDSQMGSCVPISCPEGQIPNTVFGTGSGIVTTCIDIPVDGGDDSCQLPNVKNIETGSCEAKTDCEYPMLHDSYSNTCFANPNNCSEGSKPNPLVPGTCIAYGDTSCPSGWVPINDGLNCAPSGNNSSANNASAPPTSSSGTASSTPTSTPTSTPASTPASAPSSSPSDGGDDGGDGNGGGGGTGDGGNSGNDGSGNGSASSSNSSGAGSGNGSGGSGECDPTSKTYLDCISQETGDEGEGLDDVNQKDYGLNIGDRLQQARDAYTDRLTQIQEEFSSELSVNLGTGSGSLPRNQVALWGQTVEMGIYARRDFFDAIRWVFLAVASIIALYILLSKN